MQKEPYLKITNQLPWIMLTTTEYNSLVQSVAATAIFHRQSPERSMINTVSYRHHHYSLD